MKVYPALYGVAVTLGVTAFGFALAAALDDNTRFGNAAVVCAAFGAVALLAGLFNQGVLKL